MVLTQSGQDLLRLGEVVPDFELPDVTKADKPSVSLHRDVLRLGSAADAAAEKPKAALVCWLCVHCPFVVLLKTALAELAKEYAAKGVAIVAVSSNSPQERQQDGPEGMAADARDHHFNFPYLYDGGDQAAAKRWGVACTPEFFVLDAEGRLLYHGQFDGARPSNGVAPTGEDLRRALDAALDGGRALPVEGQKRAIGCSIKWTGAETPEYAAALAVPK
jgi:thiol-disulfide isomerase/thioredoxin